MMSDVEESPTKVIKMEAPRSVDSTMEGQEEQEEWLSEGVLTDDDYLPGNLSNTEKPNLEDTTKTIENNENTTVTQQKTELNEQMEQNIEDTLNNFEKTESSPQDDAFDKLLKTENRNSDVDKSANQSDDDGNDTDDLLRMLGEDDGKMKKKVLSRIGDKQAPQEDQSSDDEYIFKGAKVTKLKVAKNAIIRKQATKAVPEDMSDRDSEMSEDEGSTVKKMFTTNLKMRSTTGRPQKPASRFTNNVNNEKSKPPPKQYTSKSNKSLLKPLEKREHDEIINEEEFLEEDDFDLDDDLGDESMASEGEQQMRRPERMDEEVPSDDDTHSDDDSLYDVLPSSDSEDMDDWFTLDIRAERAGDYLPWLGDKAHKLLTEEKQRVTARLATLKQSVSALKSSERVQEDQIKVATEALHELEAMLAAA